MMEWNGDTESEQDYQRRHWLEWQARYVGLNLTPEELDGVYRRCVERFNKVCEEIERADDDAKIRKLLSETLGNGTYMVEGN